jgi:hypothetical protein
MLCLDAVLSAAMAQDLYQSCVSKLNAEAEDVYCGGVVTGYQLGYTRAQAEGSSTTSFAQSGFAFSPTAGTTGFAIDEHNAIVVQLPPAPNGDPQEPIVFGVRPGGDATTMQKGEFAFDVQPIEAVPLSQWLARNQGSVDISELKSLQETIEEFGGDKAAIFALPSTQ